MISIGRLRGAKNLSRDFPVSLRDFYAEAADDLPPSSGEASPAYRTRCSCAASPDVEAYGLAGLAHGGAAALEIAAASRADVDGAGEDGG